MVHRKMGDLRIIFFFNLSFYFLFSAAFFAFKALALALALGEAGASIFIFGAIFAKRQLQSFFFTDIIYFSLPDLW